MEAATLDVADVAWQEEEAESEESRSAWGRLFPVCEGFHALDLVNEEYVFGRGECCDYCFDEKGGRQNQHFPAFSKTHFRLYRKLENKDSSGYLVFVQDKSSNGTFINGDRIGKNSSRVLNNNDEISLAMKTNKVFMFLDNNTSRAENLPEGFERKYTMSKPIGRGACGEVKLAFQKETCDRYAVKVISKKTFSVGPTLGRAAMEEVKILMSIQHPCIVCIEDVYDSRDALYIVLEYAEGGELFDRVSSEGKFSEATAKLLFYQLLVAVKYLHDKGITHRDLKPENVLLATSDEETLIKVTDFGLSKFVGENSLMKTLCGTPSYLAPEVLESAGMKGYGKTVDCWSLGVILFIMVGGYPPFSDEITEYSLHDQVCNGRYSFPEAFWKGISPSAIALIKQLLVVDPSKRATVTQALQHPWLQDDAVVSKAKRLMAGCTRSKMSPPLLLGSKRPATSCSDDVQSKKRMVSEDDSRLLREVSSSSTLSASRSSNSTSSSPN